MFFYISLSFATFISYLTQNCIDIMIYGSHENEK